jgi:hypothetical protein
VGELKGNKKWRMIGLTIEQEMKKFILVVMLRTRDIEGG